MYYPLRNDSGRTVCYIGADISLSYLTKYLWALAIRIGVVLISIFILIIAYEMRMTDIHLVYPLSSIALCAQNFISSGNDSKKPDEIEAYYRDGDIRNFTIKVHALKSLARVIGAATLSDMALKLEDAGSAADTDYIQAHTDALLRSYRSFTDILAPLYAKDDTALPDIPHRLLNETYEALLEISEMMDYDTAMLAVDSVKEYRLPPEDEKRFARIRSKIASKEERFEEVLKVISRNYILKFFIRPFAMEVFLDTVEDYFASSSAYAKHKSILIVDDDPGYMNLINDWLMDRYRVSMAASGVRAITWLATNHTDLILLDYEMPLTDGPQVLEMIRSQPQTANIPVIFLTGKGDKESIMSVLALKPAGYLLKSIDKNGLLENVDKIIGSME